MKPSALVLAVLLLASVAHADTSTPAGRPARPDLACTHRPIALYPACGIMGPPCCLGTSLLLPSPGSTSWGGVRALVALLSRVGAQVPDEARLQLTSMRDKKWFAKAVPLVEADPVLAPIWRGLPPAAAATPAR